jgi:Domain of unknown function (DUF4252)
MKSISLFIVLTSIVTIGSFAQSNSYQTLKDKFKDQPDVHSFSLSGWMGRAVLKMAGECEFRDAIKDLKHVRIITIPRSEFAARNVTVNGFKKVLKQDSFQELAFIHDNGEKVSIYLREGNNHENSYFVLVEEDQEVVAIELTGYLDPMLLNSRNTTLAMNK